MRLERIIGTLPSGQVEVVSVSPGCVVSFLRYGQAYPLVWAGDVRTSPQDLMTLDQAWAAAVVHNQQFFSAGATNIRVEWGSDDTGIDSRQCIRWDDGSTTERRFRDCYRRAGTGLPRVDMPLARAQRMAEVRLERNKRLTASDGDMLKAREQGDLTQEAQLKTYRQQLRDIPVTTQVAVDACGTPEALHTFTPTWPVLP